MVCKSDYKHPHQRSLPAIHQFFEPERKEISDFMPFYYFPYFDEEGRLKQCPSSQDPLAPWCLKQPELFKCLR